jgi:hypothetical protein
MQSFAPDPSRSATLMKLLRKAIAYLIMCVAFIYERSVSKKTLSRLSIENHSLAVTHNRPLHSQNLLLNQLRHLLSRHCKVQDGAGVHLDGIQSFAMFRNKWTTALTRTPLSGRGRCTSSTFSAADFSAGLCCCVLLSIDDSSSAKQAPA